jgi:hypothetical protein
MRGGLQVAGHVVVIQWRGGQQAGEQHDDDPGDQGRAAPFVPVTPWNRFHVRCGVRIPAGPRPAEAGLHGL